MDDRLEPNLGHVDFGEKVGKRLVAIHRNEDDSLDLETEDGTIYKNCVINEYQIPHDSKGTIVESMTLEMKDVKIYKENIMEAFGLEKQNEPSDKI